MGIGWEGEMKLYTIYNTKRYGDYHEFPDHLVCFCSLAQAENLAEWMSKKFAGQEGMYLVAGNEDA